MVNGNEDTKACRTSTFGYRTWKKYSNVEIPPNNWTHWRASLKTTAENMGIKITGKLEPCEVCAQAKIRQANVPKRKQKQVPSRPGYRMLIDISSFKHESMGGKRHWLIVVDEFSDYSHSFSLRRKSDQMVVIPTWIKEKFLCEVVSTASKLDNIMVRKERTKPPHTLFYNEGAGHVKYLKKWQ